MADYNFKSKDEKLTGADIRNLYVNLIKARLARGMSATAESTIPAYQFKRVTDDLMQSVTDETKKSSEQLNYRYQFPNYTAGDGYASGNLIYTDWYNQIDVVTKDMARKADCSSGCSGMCVTSCSSKCGSTCSENCGSVCRSSNCTGSCANSCSSSCGSNCSGCTGTCEGSCSGTCKGDGCTGCGSGCREDGCSGCTSVCTGCTGCSGCTSSCMEDCSGGCKSGCTGCGSGCASSCTGCTQDCTNGCLSRCTDSCSKYDGCTDNVCTGSAS